MEIHQDSTLCGLQRWFVHNFEKLGWIVLSTNKISKDTTYQKKVDAYKASVDKLSHDINERVTDPKGNKTIQTDFATMLKNLEKLKLYLSRMESITPINSDGDNLSINDMSLQWMKHYYKHVFEKFGWMVLTSENINAGEYRSKPELEKHMILKLSNYNDSIKVLLQSIKYRISKSDETDLDHENVKHDLKIMHNNLCILNGAAKLLLEEQKSMNKLEKKETINKLYVNKLNINDLSKISIGGNKNNLLSNLFL